MPPRIITPFSSLSQLLYHLTQIPSGSESQQNVTQLTILVYNNRMVGPNMPQSLERISVEAWDSAKISAGASGVSAGAWPSKVIRPPAAVALPNQALDKQPTQPAIPQLTAAQPAPAGLRIKALDGMKIKIYLIQIKVKIII